MIEGIVVFLINFLADWIFCGPYVIFHPYNENGLMLDILSANILVNLICVLILSRECDMLMSIVTFQFRCGSRNKLVFLHRVSIMKNVFMITLGKILGDVLYCTLNNEMHIKRFLQMELNFILTMCFFCEYIYLLQIYQNGKKYALFTSFLLLMTGISISMYSWPFAFLCYIECGKPIVVNLLKLSVTVIIFGCNISHMRKSDILR